MYSRNGKHPRVRTTHGTPPEPPTDTFNEYIQLKPDEWAEFDTQYPSGYIYPFHFKYPVTGKPTTETMRNARLELRPNRFGPKQKI